MIEESFAPGAKLTIPEHGASVSISGPSALKISWSPTALTSVSYKVLRSEELAGPYSLIFSTSSELEFVDTSVSPGEEYFYKIEYHSGAAVSETTPVQGIPIEAFSITNILATSTKVNVFFPTVRGATTYSLRYGTLPGVYGLEMPITSGAQVSGLTNGITYYFQVKAKNVSGGVDSVSEVSTLVMPLNIASLEFSTDFAPAANSADTAFSTQAVVKARDTDGLVVTTDSTSAITLEAYDTIGCAGAVLSAGLSGTVTRALVNGAATFTGIKAVKTAVKSIKASLGTLSACSPSLTITPGQGTQIAITSGNNQTASLSTALGSALTVTVKDTNNNLVNNATINWAAASGTLGAPTSTTNSSGVASNTFTAGTSAGAKTITATIDGTSASVSFDLSITVLAPTALTASIGDTQVGLSFTGATAATSYNVYRSTTSGSGFTLVTNISTTTHTDTGLTNGVPYYYLVKTVNNSIESTASNEVSVRPAVIPGSPLTFAGTQESQRTVLTWTAPAIGTGPLTYSIYRSTTSGSGFTLLEDELTALTHTDTGLTNATTYYYKVAASNLLGEGAYSNEIAITPDYGKTISFDFTGGSSNLAHNLAQSSEEFELSPWTHTNNVIQKNVAMAPDGTFTADKVIANTVNGSHFSQQSFKVLAGVTYTVSMYLKQAERTSATLVMGTATLWPTSNTPTVTMNMSTGNLGGSSSDSTALPVGNGWYRVSLTKTAVASGNGTIRIQLMASGSGDGVSGVYVWGGQVEQERGVGRYVRTTDSPRASFLSPLKSNLAAKLDLARADTAPVATFFASDGYVRRAPHNYLLESQNYAAASWMNASANLAILPGQSAPDGTLTASKLTRTQTATSAYIAQNITNTFSGTGTCSAFVKMGTTPLVGLRLSGSYPNRSDVVFDLSTATINAQYTNAFTGLENTIIPLQDGWFRISATATPTSTPIRTCLIAPTDAGLAVSSFEGASTVLSDVYVWGLQLEQNITASDYIPTTTTQRFDGVRVGFQPSTQAPLGLLIEEARTNRLLNSINPAGVVSDVTTTANYGTAPDFTQTSTLVTEGTAGTASIHKSTGVGVMTAGVTRTCSVFIRRGSITYIRLALKELDTGNTDSGAQVIFNLTGSGGVGSSYNIGTGTFSRATIQSIRGSWYRISLTATQDPASTSTTCFLASAANSSSTTRVNNATYQVWGVQAEVGAFASHYIPTGATAESRRKDVASTTSVSWFSPTAGTITSESQSYIANTNIVQSTASLNNNATTQRFDLRYSQSSATRSYINNGATSALLQIASMTAQLASKVAISYDGTSTEATRNGSTVTSVSTAGAIPTGITQLEVGTTDAGQYPLQGWIKNFNYYNSKLPDAEILRLSTSP